MSDKTITGRGGYVGGDEEFTGLAVRNGRVGVSNRWGVRIGHALGDTMRFKDTPEDYPELGGYPLTASEADHLAELLQACARWARAQNGLAASTGERQ